MSEARQAHKSLRQRLARVDRTLSAINEALTDRQFEYEVETWEHPLTMSKCGAAAGKVARAQALLAAARKDLGEEAARGSHS